MDAPRALLTAILREKDFTQVVDAGITDKDFTEDPPRKAFEFIREFWLEHNALPTRDTVALDFPEALLPEPEASEPLSFYIEEVLNDTRFGLLFDGIREAAGEIDTTERISKTEMDRAAARLSVLLQDYHERGGNLRAVDITRRSSEWWQQYLVDARDMRSIKGIPLGLPALDHNLGGLRPQQLVTITGLPKSGKSLVSLRAAIEASRWGYKPLFVSFEMSVDEQEERYHALNSHVSLTRMQQGRLRSAERTRVQRSFRYRERNMGGFVIAEDPYSLTTVTAVASQIEAHDPDMVVIDGVYMMDDEQGEDSGSPQAITNITRSLKRLAQKSDLPIIVTTQSLGWKTTKKRGVTGGSIGYSSSYTQDSDVVITINTDEEDRRKKRYTIDMTRTGVPMSATYVWDFEKTGVLLEVAEDEAEDYSDFDGTDI